MNPHMMRQSPGHRSQGFPFRLLFALLFAAAGAALIIKTIGSYDLSFIPDSLIYYSAGVGSVFGGILLVFHMRRHRIYFD